MGDKSEGEYLAERTAITEEPARPSPPEERPDVLAKLSRFLGNVATAVLQVVTLQLAALLVLDPRP